MGREGVAILDFDCAGKCGRGEDGHGGRSKEGAKFHVST
jgi:hypothetical protein